MRIKPRFILPALMLLLLLSYQNFSEVPQSEWDSANTQRIMKEMEEFEKTHLPKSALAVPQGGHDLKSVSDDWIQRQGSLLINGYDKKIENAVNDTLNSWLREVLRPAPVAADEHVESGAAGSNRRPSALNPDPMEVAPAKDEGRVRQNFRFARLNCIKYDIGESTSMDLTADPGNTHFTYSQVLSPSSKLGLEHRLTDNSTQMLFKYEW